MLSGGMAYIQNNFFEDVDGIADIALNAPKLKLKMGAQYALGDMGLRLGAQVRYSDSFRQSSGVYVRRRRRLQRARSQCGLSATYRTKYASDVGRLQRA